MNDIERSIIDRIKQSESPENREKRIKEIGQRLDLIRKNEYEYDKTVWIEIGGVILADSHKNPRFPDLQQEYPTTTT